MSMYANKLNIPLGLTFDDVLLIPAQSYVEPSEADIRTRFTRNIALNSPIISAAMDTVTEAPMAIALAREGSIGIIHRNMSAEREAEEIRLVKQAEDIIERKVLTVLSDSTVGEVDRMMRYHDIGGVPVMDNGMIIGIVSRRDLRGIVAKRGDENIQNVMTRKPITAKDGIGLEEALEKMYTNKVERLPVTDADGNLLGIITMQDLLERHQNPNAIRDKDGNLRVAAAVGPFDFERAVLLSEAGADALAVDCAHAHNMNVVAAVRDIVGSVSADVIAGNIATKEAAEEFGSDVDAIKVGIGPGSICTTRIVAGVGVPQITAIANVAEVMNEYDVPVIADGGIRYSGDIAKAIAAGADSVMLGSLLAGTDEAPGRLIAMKGRRYKQYRGMGSLGVMSGGESSDRYFQKKDIGRNKFVPEGVEGAIPYVGNVSDVLYQLTGGLKSAMGYTGSKTIADLRRNGRFVQITSAGYIESHPHNILITDEAPNYRVME